MRHHVPTGHGQGGQGSRTFPPDFSPGLFLQEKNVNKFSEIEAGLMKQYFSCRS